MQYNIGFFRKNKWQEWTGGSVQMLSAVLVLSLISPNPRKTAGTTCWTRTLARIQDYWKMPNITVYRLQINSKLDKFNGHSAGFSLSLIKSYIIRNIILYILHVSCWSLRWLNGWCVNELRRGKTLILSTNGIL